MKNKITRAFALMLAMIMSLSILCVCPTVSVAAEDEDTSYFIPIYTVEDLYNVRNDLNESYILMNDIDLTEATAEGGPWDFMGNGWNPIGSNDVYGDGAFSGVFDGNGHKIIGMRIDVTTLPNGVNAGDISIGLFSSVSGTVRNLKIEGGYVKQNIIGYTTSTIKAGSFAGQLTNTGTIIKCSNNNEIVYAAGKYQNNSSYVYSGGIVAINNGTIEKTYNNAIVSAKSADYWGDTCPTLAGGIVAKNSGYIIDCYNTGAYETGERCTGYGICKGGEVKNCYNIGLNYDCQTGGNTATNCYYLEVGGWATTGSTSLTEEQMLLQSMYAGFDFNNVWIQNPYAEYPYPQLRSNPQNLEEGVSLIRLVTLPEKSEYYTDDKVVPDGAMIEVVYVSGRTEMIPVTSDMLSGYDMTKAGKQTVTATYKERTVTFGITVTRRPTILSVSMATLPDDTSYAIGTEIDLSGATVLITYENGTSEIKDITECTVTGGDVNKIGDQKITVAIFGFETSFNITIEALKVEQIMLTSLPTKLSYTDVEELDTTGMVVTAWYNNGKNSTVTAGYTLSGYEKKPGKHTITVTFGGKTASFDVTVRCAEHDPGEDATCTEDQFCTTCGEVITDKLGHSYKATVTEPTCTEQGYTTHKCSNCGDTYVDSYESTIPHTPGAVATCTEDQICTVCRNVIKAKTGHDYRAKVVLPGCTEGGYTVHTCANCSDSYTDTYTDPIGYHTPGRDATCTTDKVCTACGEVLAPRKGHSPGKVATCTKDQVCTDCGEAIKAKLGHDYDSVVTEPTCTEKGYTTHTCTRCDDEYVDSYIPVADHTPGAAASCTKDQICTECGEVVKAKLGHDYEEKVTKPTCTEKGYTTHSCTRCDDEYVDSYVSATDHTLGEEATCTKDQICTSCGETLVEKKGHDYEEEWTVDKEAGINVEGSKSRHCKRCDEVTDVEKIPALVKPNFTDVKEADWYHEAVAFAVSNGLFNGTSATTFSPNANMTRAMLVTVLYRMEGSPSVAGVANTFNDVKAGQYYYDAVLWASSNGVVNGVGAGKFVPNNNVTREQMATILYRYSEKKGIDVSTKADVSVFPDSGKISSYAKDAIAWANCTGLIGGTNIGGVAHLDPLGNATRAQVAAILMRYKKQL